MLDYKRNPILLLGHFIKKNGPDNRVFFVSEVRLSILVTKKEDIPSLEAALRPAKVDESGLRANFSNAGIREDIEKLLKNASILDGAQLIDPRITTLLVENDINPGSEMGGGRSIDRVELDKEGTITIVDTGARHYPLPSAIDEQAKFLSGFTVKRPEPHTIKASEKRYGT